MSQKTKIDIISGFLGAGKTTLIKKLLSAVDPSEKVVLVENEFGEAGIDGKSFAGAALEIREINSGCICCTLRDDFNFTLKQIIRDLAPDRIIIEPSGVGKLSDIASLCMYAMPADLNICLVTLDVSRYEEYLRAYGAIYLDQLKYAKTIVLNRMERVSEEETERVLQSLRNSFPDTPVLTTPWDQISAQKILEFVQGGSLGALTRRFLEEYGAHCSCGRKGCVGGHSHEELPFQSWSLQVSRSFNQDFLGSLANKFDSGRYGKIIRAKGIFKGDDRWKLMNYVPGELQITDAEPDCSGRLCVIGESLKNDLLENLFKEHNYSKEELPCTN